MSQTDNRVIALSSLRAGDVLKVCTKNTSYRCMITGPNGEATITGSGKGCSVSYKGIILGIRDSLDRVSSGFLRPGARMHFLSVSDREEEKAREVTTSVISRIVVNGGSLVLANFGFRARLVEWP